MKRLKLLFVLVMALALSAATCGDGDAGTTTEAESQVQTSQTSIPSPTETTSTVAASSTTQAAAQSDLDCLDFWSEELVQSIAGDEFTFFDMNSDGTLCTFVAVPNSIGLSFREGDQGLFDASRSGADSVAPVTDLEGTCDTAWYNELGPTIGEGYSSGQGLIFNATVLGPADPVAAVTALLQAACDGPSSTS